MEIGGVLFIDTAHNIVVIGIIVFVVVFCTFGVVLGVGVGVVVVVVVSSVRSIDQLFIILTRIWPQTNNSIIIK